MSAGGNAHKLQMLEGMFSSIWGRLACSEQKEPGEVFNVKKILSECCLWRRRFWNGGGRHGRVKLNEFCKFAQSQLFSIYIVVEKTRGLTWRDLRDLHTIRVIYVIYPIYLINVIYVIYVIYVI